MLPVSRHLYPFLLDSNTVYIASAITTQPDTVEQSSIGQLQEINSMSDFYSRYIHVYTCIIYCIKRGLYLHLHFSSIFCRSTVLRFTPGQSYHQLVVEIINDSTPELDEQFSVQLLEPVGGAVLGTQSSLNVTILTNDDAYGLVGFAEVSGTEVI